MLCGNSKDLPSAFGWNASCSDADARPRLFACQHLPRSQFASHDGFRWIRNHPSSSSSRITDIPTDWDLQSFGTGTIFAFLFPSLLIELISSQKVVSLFSFIQLASHSRAICLLSFNSYFACELRCFKQVFRYFAICSTIQWPIVKFELFSLRILTWTTVIMPTGNFDHISRDGNLPIFLQIRFGDQKITNGALP